MKKIILLVAGILISYSLSAETMINPENNEVWAITDDGAYNANNSKLIKSGDKFYGGDGRIYMRQGNKLLQIGGPRQAQMQQPQKIQIQITTPSITTAPIRVPMHPYFHSFQERRSISRHK